MALDGPLPIMGRLARGKRDDIADALVRTLFVKMCWCIGLSACRRARSPNRISFENTSDLTDRTHRSAKAFKLGDRGWQGHALDASGIDNILKSRTIFAVSIMDEVLAGLQKAPSPPWFHCGRSAVIQAALG